MDIEHTQEMWQVEAAGKVFDTNFAEMTVWIDQGALLRQDKVRKGNLRWIEAGKVPSLMAVFNAKDTGQPIPRVVTTTKIGPTTIPVDSSANTANFSVSPVNASVYSTQVASTYSGEPMCSMHAETPAVFICETCANQFCKACPNSYGGTVKICPYCGAMCKSLQQMEQARAETHTYYAPVGAGFGISDFGAALAYPFKFRTSLILGAFMYMFFSIGKSAVGFGGIFMLGAAVFSTMLANTLTFGILANTVENFSQGKIGENFMPGFDDFSVWDDVFHPFFLSIGVYLSSFGPLMAVAAIAFFMITGTVNTEMNGIQSDAARTVSPELPYAANAVRQSERVREILKKDTDEQKQRVEAINSGEVPPDDLMTRSAVKDADQFNEEKAEEMNQIIQNTRKAQLESTVGKAPDTVTKERADLVKKILGYGAVFILLGGACLLWGLFYFPAACAVAGYTRSFGATLNPAVGLDTIRRLGADYAKILVMCLVVALMAVFVGGVLSAVLSAFDMPGVGNLPANAIGSLFTFYFSIVFSCIIGFALYKAADRLRLYR